MYGFTVVQAGSPRSGCWRVGSSWRVLLENLSCASVPAPGGCRGSWVCSSVTAISASMSLRGLLPESLRPDLPSALLKRHRPLHLGPAQSRDACILTSVANYIGIDPLSISGPVLRFWVDVSFGGCRSSTRVSDTPHGSAQAVCRQCGGYDVCVCCVKLHLEVPPGFREAGSVWRGGLSSLLSPGGGGTYCVL